MAEETITEDSEKSEQTVSEEALAKRCLGKVKAEHANGRQCKTIVRYERSQYKDCSKIHGMCWQHCPCDACIDKRFGNGIYQRVTDVEHQSDTYPPYDYISPSGQKGRFIDEEIYTDALKQKACFAIESYVNLVETITGVEVNWHALSGGPECDLWFLCETKKVDDGYTPVDGKVIKFIDETAYIRDEIEVLMKEAMIAYIVYDKRNEDGLGLIEGAKINIFY